MARFATLRALFGALAPVAVVPADGSPTVACPGRDHKVDVGDRVTVLGTPEELEAADLVPAKAGDDGSGLRVHHHRTGAGLLRRIVALLGSDDNSALRFAMVAASVLVVAVDARPPAGLPPPPRRPHEHPHRPLLHRGDHLHGGVRRLLLRRPVHRPSRSSGSS